MRKTKEQKQQELDGMVGMWVTVVFDDPDYYPFESTGTLGKVKDDGEDYPSFYYVGNPQSRENPFIPFDANGVRTIVRHSLDVKVYVDEMRKG